MTIIEEELCKELKDHALKIINYEKKEMIPLPEEENKSYGEQGVCHIAIYAEKSFIQMEKTKKYQKVKEHYHYTGKFRGCAHNNL